MIRRFLLWLVQIEPPALFWTLAIIVITSVLWVPMLVALAVWVIAGPEAGLWTAVVALPLGVVTGVLVMPDSLLDPRA